MITDEQLGRLRTLARLYIEELPDGQALNSLILIFDICEILTLTADQLALVFGDETLRWVTGLVYGESGAAT